MKNLKQELDMLIVDAAYNDGQKIAKQNKEITEQKKNEKLEWLKIDAI